MAENKTLETKDSVNKFLDTKVSDAALRKDCDTLIALMEKVTGQPATMWGTAIIGFDKYHYKYDSGREGDMCLVGFSPRAANISLYVKLGAPGQDALLAKLGRHKAAKGCLYVKKLADVDMGVLENIITTGAAHTRQQYPG
ncbi:DUF1801 domain-containing protein [Mucilaginibacter boryungensis]|uniref:DUF1801 domain-containing protein n=1 Tax=Mucilaginibacter boryungensis TaxID=768480 RepID=A0ABR9XHL1_9SPHI|nr:DUF1801 domain-containing protein [Mucilaginibacter boryungensis]MBE9666873.1 DUF1801 domain-containing protein [Mucilaginibacter boryungensis]